MSKGLIVIDPGHGEKGNPHPTREGFSEGPQNFILGCHLRDELESRGFEVKMTREKVTDDPSLQERGQLAGKNGAILFLSLHSNAPGTEAGDRYSKIRGAETFYSVTDPERNADLASRLTEAVVKTMGTSDRGIKTRRHPDNEDWDYYGVIRASAQSGCKTALLIEHGFHTNPEDSAFLQSDECLSRLAASEAEVIDKFFS